MLRLPSLVEDTTDDTCNECNKHVGILRHKNSRNRKKSFTEKTRSKWYYPSHGDDLELEGDKVIKTPPEENRRRRTIILYKLNNSWGFSIQSYGIHHRKKDVMEHLTYVDNVEAGGAAYQAGMRPGDVILSINGKSMEDVQHKDLVTFIKHTGDTMRVVVLFEDCCKKVELHMKYLQLQRTLAEKMFELRSLELQEKRIMKGLPQFDRSRSDRSSSTCSLGSSFTETLSLVPELDRCPSPVLSPRSRIQKGVVELPDPPDAPDRMTQSVTVLSDVGTNRLKVRGSNHVKTGSMVDLSELGRVRKKKRRKIGKLELDAKHFQLSPNGGAKSKGLVEKLPKAAETIAVVPGCEATGQLSLQNGRGNSLESEMNKLNVQDVMVTRSSSNLEQGTLGKNGTPRSRSTLSLSESAPSELLRPKVHLNKSIPCLWPTSSSVSVNKSRSHDVLLDTNGTKNGHRHRTSPSQHKVNGVKNSSLKSRTSLGSPSPDQIKKKLSFSEESPSSEEFYQTFIEGDVDSPVSPKLNWSTHPILMKSESAPSNIRRSKDSIFDSLDDVILPSPMRKEDHFTFNDVNSKKPRVTLLHQSVSSGGLTRSVNGQRNSDSDYRSRSMSESGNRESDVSLRSLDSSSSRFSYNDLPGINISFTSDEEVTQL